MEITNQIMYDGILLTDALSDYGIKPSGAYQIANLLRLQGYNILVINIYSRLKFDALEEILRNNISKNTIFFGYSSTLFCSWDYKNNDYNWTLTDEDFFKNTNYLVKEIKSDIKILYGGSCSYKFIEHVQRISDNLGVDYVMHGYGDSMIIDLINNIKNNQQTRFSNKVHGIYEIDYDNIASNFDFRNYTHTWNTDDIIAEGEALPLEVARGCIFKCKFCAFPLLGKNKNDLSYLKDEEILLSEILANYDKFKTKSYLVVDDTFNERIEKIEMMLRIRDKSKIDLNFVGYNRLDLITRIPQQLSLLRDLKFNGMLFGIESMHRPSAMSIGKGIKPEEVKETLYKIRDAYNEEISISGSFIIGLPHETPETFESWAEWVISDESPFDAIFFQPLIIGQVKNTHNESEYFRDYKKYGYELSEDRKKWSNQYWTSDQCSSLTFKYTNKIEISGKQRISPFVAIAFTKFGYDYREIFKRPLNTIVDINTPKFGKRLLIDKNIENKALEYENWYFSKLKGKNEK